MNITCDCCGKIIEKALWLVKNTIYCFKHDIGFVNLNSGGANIYFGNSGFSVGTTF